MVDHELCIFVTRCDAGVRRVSIGATLHQELGHLVSGINTCDYDYTATICLSLEKLLAGELREFEWGGGERIWFRSYATVTRAIDCFGWTHDCDLPTTEIHNLMDSRLRAMQDYSQAHLRSKVVSAFVRLKEDPPNTLAEGSHIRLDLDGDDALSCMRFFLDEGDLNFSCDEVSNQLRFDAAFFAPN